jgi:hypothetical protein
MNCWTRHFLRVRALSKESLWVCLCIPLSFLGNNLSGESRELVLPLNSCFYIHQNKECFRYGFKPFFSTSFYDQSSFQIKFGQFFRCLRYAVRSALNIITADGCPRRSSSTSVCPPFNLPTHLQTFYTLSDTEGVQSGTE